MIHLTTVKTGPGRYVICSSDCVGKYERYREPIGNLGVQSDLEYKWQAMAQSQAQYQGQQTGQAFNSLLPPAYYPWRKYPDSHNY